MRTLAIFVRGVNRFNRWLGPKLRWIVWGLMGLFLFEAASRYGFQSPHAWSLEITAYVFAAYFLLASGYVLLTEGHIRMDVFYIRWSPRKRAIADIATFPVAAIYLVVLIWRGFLQARISIMIGETTPSAAATLLGPVKTFIVIGAAILLVQAIAILIQDLHVAIKGKTLELE